MCIVHHQQAFFAKRIALRLIEKKKKKTQKLPFHLWKITLSLPFPTELLANNVHHKCHDQTEIRQFLTPKD